MQKYKIKVLLDILINGKSILTLSAWQFSRSQCFIGIKEEEKPTSFKIIIPILEGKQLWEVSPPPRKYLGGY